LTLQTEKNSWIAVYLALIYVGYQFVVEWVQSNPEVVGMQWDTLLILVLASVLGGLILVKQMLRPPVVQ
jgi:EamA domain-containing membrane protein RarD